MLCPNCESDNRDGAKFCDECGFPLTGVIAARAAEIVADNSDSEEDMPSEQITEVIEPVEDSSDETEFIGEDDFHPECVEYEEEFIESEELDAVPADITSVLQPDFAGLDQLEDTYGERVVGPDYQEPQANWRDGHTMQMPRIEGDEAPRSKDFLASSTTKQNNKKKIIIGAIAAVVVIAAVIAFATYQMQLWGGKVIPDVRGMTEADATSVLEESGFEVRSTQVKSDDTEGLVLLMDPNAGARANEGDEIVIHIATARTIPSVVGKSEKDAQAAFADAGYENVTYAKEHSDEPEGTVLSVSPEAGTRAKSSIAVTVKVAEPYIVPDTSSMGLDACINAIQSAGLGYDVAYVDTQDYPDGAIIGTEPVAGTKVKHDTVVVIEVARARGVQLVQLTKNMLTPGSTVTIDGVSYEIESVGNVSYVGNDTVSFTMTGKPFTYFMGQYVVLDSREVTGQVVWTADNGVASIS